jgi:hypothetical protein
MPNSRNWVHGAKCVRCVIEQDGLQYFELQPTRSQTGIGKRSENNLKKVGVF